MIADAFVAINTSNLVLAGYQWLILGVVALITGGVAAFFTLRLGIRWIRKSLYLRNQPLLAEIPVALFIPLEDAVWPELASRWPTPKSSTQPHLDDMKDLKKLRVYADLASERARSLRIVSEILGLGTSVYLGTLLPQFVTDLNKAATRQSAMMTTPRSEFDYLINVRDFFIDSRWFIAVILFITIAIFLRIYADKLDEASTLYDKTAESFDTPTSPRPAPTFSLGAVVGGYFGIAVGVVIGVKSFGRLWRE